MAIFNFLFDQDLFSFNKDFDQNISRQWLGFSVPVTLARSFPDPLTIIDPWRENFLKLKDERINCFPDFSNLRETFFDGAFLQLSKHKGQNKNAFLRLYKHLKIGGVFLIKGDKNLGAPSFYKKILNLFPFAKKISKQHSLLIFFEKKTEVTKEIIKYFFEPPLFFDSFKTEAGMFSHGRVDQASHLLQHYLPKNLKGKIADFGAGWGYLTKTLLENAKMDSHIDCFEADYNALLAMKQNIEQIIMSTKKSPLIQVHYHWCDLLQEEIPKDYDLIVSNPPFHVGKYSDPNLGRAFIVKAAHSLKKNAMLYIVANKHLPYEEQIRHLFHTQECLIEKNGYKVIKAIK